MQAKITSTKNSASTSVKPQTPHASSGKLQTPRGSSGKLQGTSVTATTVMVHGNNMGNANLEVEHSQGPQTVYLSMLQPMPPAPMQLSMLQPMPPAAMQPTPQVQQVRPLQTELPAPAQQALPPDPMQPMPQVQQQELLVRQLQTSREADNSGAGAPVPLNTVQVQATVGTMQPMPQAEEEQQVQTEVSGPAEPARKPLSARQNTFGMQHVSLEGLTEEEQEEKIMKAAHDDYLRMEEHYTEDEVQIDVDGAQKKPFNFAAVILGCMAVFGVVTISILVAMALSPDCGCGSECDAAQKWAAACPAVCECES